MNWLKDLIRFFEGLRLKAYKCPAGVWTCGYGSTGPDVTPTTQWTQEQAEQRMQSDAERFMLESGTLSPVLFFSDRKHAAIADFCYNLGSTRYKSSTLKRRIDVGDWDGARDELMKWVFGGGKKLPGLVKRRAAEADLLGESHG